MNRKHKFSEFLELIQRDGLMTLDNAFLKGSSLKYFKGNFLIVSDTKKSKKYFLSLNITNKELEENSDYTDILGGSNCAWTIALIHFITKKKTKLFVWSEGVVEYIENYVKFTQGPGEINCAWPERIISVIKDNTGKREASQTRFYTFFEFEFLFNSSKEEESCLIFDLEMLKKYNHLI